MTTATRWSHSSKKQYDSNSQKCHYINQLIQFFIEFLSFSKPLSLNSNKCFTLESFMQKLSLYHSLRTANETNDQDYRYLTACPNAPWWCP